MILLAFGAWAAYEALKRVLGLPNDNPLTPLFVISYPLPRQLGESSDFYGKGKLDVLFLAFYIIVFSCFRQSVTEYLIKPYANWLGLKGAKAQRFVEQGYAVTYWGSSSIIGLVRPVGLSSGLVINTTASMSCRTNRPGGTTRPSSGAATHTGVFGPR